MVAGNVERRSMGALGRMGIVAGMHVAVVFLIARSLGIVPPILQPERIEVTTVDEPANHDDPLPATGPTLVEPPLYVPIPDDAPPEPPAQTEGIAARPITDNPVIDGLGSAVVPGLIVNAR